MSVESSAASLVVPDVFVDGFVANSKQSVESEGAADLFGAEVGLDALFDEQPVLVTQKAFPSRTSAS